MPQPWDKDRRAATMAKIRKEAERAAARVGAKGAVLIALYPDGENIHLLDAGFVPANLDLAQLYRMMLSANAIVQDSDGEDVKVN